MLEEREVAFVPLPRGIFAGSGADSIAVGVHVRWRPTGNRSQHFCTGDVFDHAIAPEFPPAINGITRRSVPDATLAIDAASRSFGDFRFWGEAEVGRAAEFAASIENDPYRKCSDAYFLHFSPLILEGR
jgi:hypothetical protein